MRITDKLLRQRSEHNDGILDELEEVALHQLEIEKIENLDKLCKHLKILLLQNNIIGKNRKQKKRRTEIRKGKKKKSCWTAGLLLASCLCRGEDNKVLLSPPFVMCVCLS